MEPNAKVLSVNVGQPRLAEWQGRKFETSIFKSPVAGPVAVEGVLVAGDSQADPRYHGGPTMAVYGYPSEHYAGWRDATPDSDLDWGAMGENLTTVGLLETETRIGDRFRIGGVELVVTQPRTPCFKLQARLRFAGALKHMIDTDHCGYYFAIARGGTLAAGDKIERVSRPDHAVTIHDLVRLDREKSPDPAEIEAAAAVADLTDDWRSKLQSKAHRLRSGK